MLPTFLIILMGLGVIAGIFLVYMGFHKQIVIKHKRFGKHYALYREHQAEYSKDMSRLFGELYRDIGSAFGRDKEAFGIYYDNPQSLVDPKAARVVVGIFLAEQDMDKAKSFVTQRSDFRFKVLPDVDIVTTTIPYRNFLTFIWGNAKVCPALFNHLGEKRLVNDVANDTHSVMEVYHWGGSDKTIEYVVTFGEHSNEYYLPHAARPARK